jgi:hypothetical protein
MRLQDEKNQAPEPFQAERRWNRIEQARRLGGIHVVTWLPIVIQLPAKSWK